MPQIPPWPEFGLHVLAKPIGPMCNLRCRYCFYLEKESLYGSAESWRMNDETLEAYIRQYIEAQPATTQDINFTFQGGEPTLMGLDFFRRAIELEKKYLPPGKSASNSLQTNGILLDDQWCEFLRENQFLVGLSLDGPKELHDAYRTDSLQRGSFDRVMRGLRCMQKHGVNFNTIACIHRRNGDHPVRVYRFLRDNGVQFMQFIPVVQPATTNTGMSPDQPEAWVTPESVLPEQFGCFLIGLFDEWAYHDVGQIEIGDFEQVLMNWRGVGSTTCIYKQICGRASPWNTTATFTPAIISSIRITSWATSTNRPFSRWPSQRSKSSSVTPRRHPCRRPATTAKFVFSVMVAVRKTAFFETPMASLGCTIFARDTGCSTRTARRLCAPSPTPSVLGVVHRKSCGSCRQHRPHRQLRASCRSYRSVQ